MVSKAKIVRVAALSGVSAFTLLASFIPSPSWAEDQLPDAKSGFFERTRVDEDFFKSNAPAMMSGPLDRSRLAPPPPAAPEANEEQSAVPGGDSAASAAAAEPANEEDSEGLGLKNEVLKRAQEDSSVGELFDRARMIKEQVGVLKPSDGSDSSTYGEKIKQFQDVIGSGTPGKKKIESNRF